MPNAETNLIRRGQKIRNGRTRLDEKHGSGRRFQRLSRQARGVPRERRRQGLGQKVVAERREVAPIGIAADQLDDPRHEHEAKQEPPREPNAGGRRKSHEQRDNCRLQQERVPLEGHKRLPGVEQREIKRIDQHKAETREEIEKQHQRQAGPAPAHGPNGEIAVVQPEHHRHEDKTRGPETGSERVDEFGERQDAAAADQSLRLHGEGYEGAKGDEPKQAKEQERDQLVARRLVIPAPQHEADAEEGRAAPGDKGVSKLRDRRETGQVAVESEPESFAARMGQRQETGLGAARAPAVGRDELHRALKFRFRNRRILRQDLLIRPVFDAVARQLLPIAGPIAAEPAVAVIEELRPRAGGWRFDRIDGVVCGWLLHNINDGWRPLTQSPISCRNCGPFSSERLSARDIVIAAGSERDETRV